MSSFEIKTDISIGLESNRGFWSSLNFVLNQLLLHQEEANSGNFYPK